MQEKETQAGFVQRTLPWIVAAGALVLYLITLNHWITIASLPVVAKVTQWDWWTLTLQSPLFYALTYPVRWLPRGWQPLALNLFAAVCAAGTVGLLARSVTLLPHDRTRDQRQRERSEFSLLSLPAAWVPPILASLAFGLQLTFWEHATAATGESLNLLMFAFLIFCLLKYRVEQDESWLDRLAFVYGLAVANNWAMIGFFPAFLIAMVWIKGWGFFRGPFLMRMVGLGLLGLLLYLLLPMAERLSDKTSMTFWELLRRECGFQKSILTIFPKYVVLLCGLTSLLPVLVMGFRWPSTFGDTSVVGAILTNLMFRVVHVLFLATCLWVMFDPPFSPRALGFGLPFLTFYYLSALSIGYFSGYFLLVFGKEPQKRHAHVSPLARQVNRLIAGLVWIALLAVPALLVNFNWPRIQANNGPYLAQLAASLAQGLPAKGAMVLSDEIHDLLLVEAALDRAGAPQPHLLIDTSSLPYQAYHSNLRRRFPQRWPDLLSGQNVPDPIHSLTLLQWLMALSRTNETYYVHPSYGFFFEGLHAQPRGLVYRIQPYEPSVILPPAPSPADLATNLAFWTQAKANLAGLPQAAQQKGKNATLSDAMFVARFLSRAANYWGVDLQRNNHLDEAGQSFDLALEFNPDNVVATVNREFNRSLRSGQSPAVRLSAEVEGKIQKYRTWEDLWREDGPFDEIRFCMQMGESFGMARPPLIRQGAHQFMRVRSLDPSNTEAAIWLANMFLQWPLPDKAMALVQEVRAGDKIHPISLANQIELCRLEAWIYAAQSNLTAAEKIIEEAEKRYPGEPSLPETLSQILLQSGRYTNALAALEQQLRLDPNNVKALLNQGAIYIQMKNYPLAIPPLNRVLQAEPKNNAALMNRAIAHLQSGKLDAAQQDYEALLQLIPDFHRAYYGLGQIAYQRRDTRRAISYYESYLKHSPTSRNPSETEEVQFIKERLNELRSGASSK